MRKRAKKNDEAKRLMSIPGIGPICTMAIQAFAPPMEGFRRGRDFSAWLSLAPCQCSTGGKPKLGWISKMGQRDLRRLLIAGAITAIRWASRRGADDSWMAALLMPAAAALATKIADRLGRRNEEGILQGSRVRLRDGSRERMRK